MSATERFLDTNVLVYTLSADPAKSATARAELRAGGTVSVQVLNEFAAVGLRKLVLSPPEIREALSVVRLLCRTVSLDVADHDRALELVEQHRLSWYDALVVASAERAGARDLVTEDMQDGRRIGALTVRNPFRPSPQTQPPSTT